MISSIEVSSSSESITFIVKQRIFFGLIRWKSKATFSAQSDLGQRLMGKTANFTTKRDWAILGAKTAFASFQNGRTDLLQVLTEVYETVEKTHLEETEKSKS